MLFLTEWSSGVEVLTEQTDSGKVLYLEGPMIMTERQNRNGRIYPKPMMEKAVDKYIKEYVEQRRAIGELNHPDRPFANPAFAALKIESMHWQGNDVVGKARVLNNPFGQQIKSLIEADFNLGVSTRGLGEIKERAGQKYVENYLLNAIDAVDMPSGQTCYVSALRESTEWVLNESGAWVESVDQDKAMKLFADKFGELLEALKRK